MTNRPENTRPLTGHALKGDGGPHDLAGQRLNRQGEVANVSYSISAAGAGRALCECGELSDELPSRNARARWHREHKMTLRHPETQE